MSKWFGIFKSGTHTNGAGVEKTYTNEDLDSIVARYNPAEFKAPIVIGHPKTDDPAYGWIGEVKRVGSMLFAKASEVVPEFAEAVNKGFFKNRSIALNKDGSLRHVGFLGAVPPAVKGLGDVSFSEEDQTETFEEETTAFDISDEILLALEENEKLKATFADLQTTAANETAAKEAAAQELDRLRLVMRKTEYQQFLNEQIAYGNVLPAQAETITTILNFLDTVQFAQGETFAEGAEPVALFKQFIKGLPKIIEFNATASPEKNEDVPIAATDIVAKEIRSKMNV